MAILTLILRQLVFFGVSLVLFIVGFLLWSAVFPESAKAWEAVGSQVRWTVLVLFWLLNAATTAGRAAEEAIVKRTEPR